MIEQLEELRQKAFRELAGIDDSQALEAWRVRYLGKKSELTGVLRSLATLPLEEKKIVGARANEAKASLEASFRAQEQVLRQSELASVKSGAIDITLPGRLFPTGHLHPITQALEEICQIFSSLGFQVVEGPEVEWDYYNFEALNIPEEHPARDNMSTFWVDSESRGGKNSKLLRTHTTSVTARTIAEVGQRKRQLPIRVVEPGKVYRYEASDATHVTMFHQIDALVVDRGVTMADLKGTLYEFARRFFGENRNVRFRCDYFPFVEPGIEIAVECAVCTGRGCRLCGNSGWIEIGGAGMTHPRVLERGGIDPQVYTSFAFGIGIDRLPMLRYGIDDVRLFYGNDLRFLRQF